MKTLIQSIKEDISKFMEDNKTLFFNEREFQMHLCVMLKESPNEYDDIYLEYRIPQYVFNSNEKTNDYIWNNDLRLDIVVERDNEFCPIELKYKTKSIDKLKISRFGDILLSDVLKDQSAEDLGMYHFWKDVYRIELVRNHFEKVKNGLAIFLTNNPRYTKRGREDSKHINFSMDSTRPQPREKVWQIKTTDSNNKKLLENQYPGFVVSKQYKIDWKTKFFNPTENGVSMKVPFYYCILDI